MSSGPGTDPMKDLNSRRRRSVRLRLAGAGISAAQKASGLSRNTVISAYKAFEAGGWPAVDVARTGRPVGSGRLLTARQEDELFGWIRDTSPDRLGLPHRVWSQPAVEKLIAKQFGITLANRTVALYLTRYGISLMHPLKRMRERGDYVATEWFYRLYRDAAEEAKSVGAELRWCDWQALQWKSSRVANDGEEHLPGAAPPTQRPKGRVVVYSMTNGRVANWLCYERLNSTSTTDFFDRLSKSSARRIRLILTSSRFPFTRQVVAWLRANRSRLTCIDLDDRSISDAVEDWHHRH